jgi:hypothetical protein
MDATETELMERHSSQVGYETRSEKTDRVSVDDPRTSGRYGFVHIFRAEAGGQDELLPRFQNHKQKNEKVVGPTAVGRQNMGIPSIPYEG